MENCNSNSKISLWLTFADDKLPFEQYVHYQVQESQVFFLIFICVGLMLSAIVTFVVSVVSGDTGMYVIISVIARTVRMVAFGAYTYTILERRFDMKYKLNLNILYTGNVATVGYVIVPAIVILCTRLSDGCPWEKDTCENSVSTLLHSMVTLSLVIILCPIVVKVYNISILVLSVLVAYAIVMIILWSVRGVRGSYTSVLSGLILVMVIVYTIRLGSMKSFVNYHDFKESARAQIMTELDKQAVERQSGELRSLIGNIAHDLKTPLQAFLYELDGLVECRDDANRIETVDSLRGVCSFMTMMINRSIDFTKISSGFALIPSYESIHLLESIDWVLGCVGKGRVRESSVNLSVDPLPIEVHGWVITDKQWLLENLLCLTSNAVKFVLDGSITVRVLLVRGEAPGQSEVSKRLGEDHEHIELVDAAVDVKKKSKLRIDTSYPRLFNGDIEVGTSSGILRDTDTGSQEVPEFLKFEVEDTGIGISDELRKKLFKPFQQAQRRAGGTGLGLFALSQRVKALGGQCGINDRSDGQRGSCFWFTIPYRPDFSLMRPASARSRSSSCMGDKMSDMTGNSDPVIDQRPSRVLLVDDSVLIQKTSSRALKKEGFVVDIAVNGEECVRMSKDGDYDVILLDLQMPVMDGFEAITRIRARESEKEREGGSTQEFKFSSVNWADDGTGGGRQFGQGRWNRHGLFVIGVSANSDSLSKENALAAGMDAFITKPLTIDMLRECCRKGGVDLYPAAVVPTITTPRHVNKFVD